VKEAKARTERRIYQLGRSFVKEENFEEFQGLPCALHTSDIF